jgi:hypothetical protein
MNCSMGCEARGWTMTFLATCGRAFGEPSTKLLPLYRALAGPSQGS